MSADAPSPRRSRKAAAAERTPGASPSGGLSPTAYARSRNITRQAVQQAIASGRLTERSARFVDGRWLIDPAAADEEWRSNTRQRRGVNDELERTDPGANELRAPRALGEGPLVIGPDELPVGPDGEPLKPTQVAAWKTAIEAQIKTLELAKLRGELVPADLVEQRLEHVGRVTRDSVLAVPSRLAQQLAALTDPAELEIVLERELTRALLAVASRSEGERVA